MDVGELSVWLDWKAPKKTARLQSCLAILSRRIYFRDGVMLFVLMQHTTDILYFNVHSPLSSSRCDLRKFTGLVFLFQATSDFEFITRLLPKLPFACCCSEMSQPSFHLLRMALPLEVIYLAEYWQQDGSISAELSMLSVCNTVCCR